MAAGLPGAYLVYRHVAAAAAPLVLLQLRWRGALGEGRRWQQLLGHGCPRKPSGPLLWFHAASVGESAAAVPIVQRCLQARPAVHILMTTRDVSALSVLEKTFSQRVTCQLAPIDTPQAVALFLRHWNPQAGVFMESELWPSLLLSPFLDQVPLALLNARISSGSFSRWQIPIGRPLVECMLERFSLVAPPNSAEGVKLQLLGANPFTLRFPGDLKYGTSGGRKSAVNSNAAEELKQQIGTRHVWLAASTHPGEEDAVARVHIVLKRTFADLLTVIVPRHPRRSNAILQTLLEQGLSVGQRSLQEPISPSMDIYLADTLGELRMFYGVIQVAFVGGSLLEGLQGHNMAEAALAGCAVITGLHVGHFAGMVAELQRFHTRAVYQVKDEQELLESVEELLGKETQLKERAMAAKRAAELAAAGVTERTFAALEAMVLRPAFGEASEEA